MCFNITVFSVVTWGIKRGILLKHVPYIQIYLQDDLVLFVSPVCVCGGGGGGAKQWSPHLSRGYTLFNMVVLKPPLSMLYNMNSGTINKGYYSVVRIRAGSSINTRGYYSVIRTRAGSSINTRGYYSVIRTRAGRRRSSSRGPVTVLCIYWQMAPRRS